MGKRSQLKHLGERNSLRIAKAKLRQRLKEIAGGR